MADRHPESGQFTTAGHAARPAESAAHADREQRLDAAVAEMTGPVSPHDAAMSAPSTMPDGTAIDSC